MAKQLIKNYTFNAAAKTITLTDFTTVLLERIQLIVDATTNMILYNFADGSIASASASGNVITLSTVSGASSTDKLQIIYDTATGDPTYDTLPVSAAALPLPSGAATSASQSAGNSSLSSIDTKTPALSSGRVPVDGSGVTQPVSGTVTANAGTGTMAVSASSLPLPSGAATSAKQPALGTAGTPSADVLSVQGAASMTALKVDGSAVTQPVGSAAAISSAIPSTAFLIGASIGGNLKELSATNTGDGIGLGNMLGVAAEMLMWNGASHDRVRNNLNTTTGDTGPKASTFNGATQTNYNARGAIIVFNLGAGFSGGTSPAIVFKLQGSADGGTTWFDVPGASTASITAGSQAVALAVYPGATVAANAAVSFPLPRTWRVVGTVTGSPTTGITLTNVQVAYTL